MKLRLLYPTLALLLLVLIISRALDTPEQKQGASVQETDLSDVSENTPALTSPIKQSHLSEASDHDHAAVNISADMPKISDRPLSERMRFDTEGLEIIEHPDGRKSANLQGRFMHIAIASVDEEGNRTVACTADHDHLTHTNDVQTTHTHEENKAQIR